MKIVIHYNLKNMKPNFSLVILFVLLSTVSSEEDAYVFGQKDTKGKWITCSEEEPDCRVKINDPEAACVYRHVIAIGNPRDNEYVNMIRKDPDMEPGRNSTRCMSDDLKEHFLDFSGIKDLSTLMTADYKYFEVPDPPPEPPKILGLRLGISWVTGLTLMI